MPGTVLVPEGRSGLTFDVALRDEAFLQVDAVFQITLVDATLYTGEWLNWDLWDIKERKQNLNQFLNVMAVFVGTSDLSWTEKVLNVYSGASLMWATWPSHDIPFKLATRSIKSMQLTLCSKTATLIWSFFGGNKERSHKRGTAVVKVVIQCDSGVFYLSVTRVLYASLMY